MAAKRKMSVNIGRPWPEIIAVEIEHPKNKRDWRIRAILYFCLMFGVAFLAFMVFGMYYRDGQVLEKVWNLTYMGVGGTMVWAFGRVPRGGRNEER